MDGQDRKLDELSAEELYALARQRQQEEEQEKIEAFRERRNELKAERREMLLRHRRELAQIDKEIEEMGGGVVRRQRASKGPRTSDGDGSATISQALCDIVAQGGEMDTQTIRVQAETQGVDTRNLSQTLAYLKRQGRLESPRRGVYRPAADAA